jgi:hypothetical protein
LSLINKGFGRWTEDIILSLLTKKDAFTAAKLLAVFITHLNSPHKSRNRFILCSCIPCKGLEEKYVDGDEIDGDIQKKLKSHSYRHHFNIPKHCYGKKNEWHNEVSEFQEGRWDEGD